jgi:hypothetical protein
MQSIVVILKGGLGNQLFQFAYAHALSKEYNAKLYLDISFFDKDARHGGYMLDSFNLPQNIKYKNISQINKFTLRLDSKLNGLLNKIFKLGYIAEKYQNLNNRVILDGYFQNENLFKDYKKDLINIFSDINLRLDSKTLQIIEKIKNTNSVSTHIRRGDYLNKNNIKIFNQLSELYYQNAINFIKDKREDNITLFIFSNDIGWVKNNFKEYKNIVFVDNKNPLIDLHLMSLCKHNIIANSTFSWWGAWLNKNDDKIVIAPKKWFNDKSKNTSDLIPKQWIKL